MNKTPLESRSGELRQEEDTTVIVLNGPIGVGKTTVARHLLLALDRSAVIDGELVTLVRPFDPHGLADFDHACETISMLLERHVKQGVPMIIITWILENPAHIRRFLEALPGTVRGPKNLFLLLCEEQELRKRITRRDRPDAGDETRRAIELSRSFWKQSQDPLHKLGYPIDTTKIVPEHVAEVVRDRLTVWGESS
jgi:hypothetical protein